MTISCDLVQDILPLYHDGVCSEDSKRIVEKHLSQCDECKAVLARISDTMVDDSLALERDDVVRHHTQAVKRKSMIVGISIASIMAVPIVVCLIVNLISNHALDWFFIVLTALMTAASLTVVPLIMEERKGLWTLGSFAGSLTLLLLTCCIYSGGDWFFVAAFSVLCGLFILFAPFLITQIVPQRFAPGSVRYVIARYLMRVSKSYPMMVGFKIATILATAIVVCFTVNLYAGHTLDWFFIVLTSVMTAASITSVPLMVQKRKGLCTLGSFTGSLTLLLLTCCIYSGGDWFAVAMIPILFSLSVLFAPFVIAQIPLKGFASTNKGLLAMIVDTILLFAVVIVSGLYGGYGADFWQNGLIITSICLLFPWVLFLIIRYLKANAFVRAGLSVVFSGIFLSMIESMIDFILYGKFHIKFANEANLLVWNTNTIDSNVTLLILISGFVIGGVLLIVGLLRKKD